MSQKDFKTLFLENILEFLWRQWSIIGVLGEARTKDPWLIDPEPMLLFTLEMGRYEPRLFDEVMDWLAVNGKWIDLQRIRGILQRKDKTTKGLMGAVAAYLVEECNARKWKNLANLVKIQLPVNGSHAESLFYQKDGQPYPMVGNPDRSFLSFGFHRPKLKLRRLTRETPISAQRTIRFLLRALFGVGSRTECLIYLLTHDGGHPAEVAKSTGLSIRGTQDALIDLSRSGLVLTRVKGKRKIEYWLSHERWWKFLSGASITEIEKPVWIDWISLYSALSQLWITLDEMSRESLSDYMRSSRLRDCLESVGNELSRSGLDIPTIPGRDIRPLEYEREFERFILRVLGAK
jgi:hypothetical protein